MRPNPPELHAAFPESCMTIQACRSDLAERGTRLARPAAARQIARHVLARLET